MKHVTPMRWIVPGLISLFAWSAQPALAELTEAGSPWRVGVSAGWLDLEGDEQVGDSFLASLHLGYATSERWTLEGVLDVVPELDESFRVNWSDGERVSRLQEESNQGVHSTSSTRFSLDGLYSLAPNHRLEPYVGLGAGAIWYEEDFGSQWEPAVRLRAGCQFHLDSSWAIRADVCAMVAGWDVEANSIGSLGIVWKLGKPQTPSVAVALATPPENLQFFELPMGFAPDSWTIRAEYFSDLDALGRILKDDPGATARIESHVDRKANAIARSEKRLTQKRADEVLAYFVKNLKISSRRLTAVGYGFEHPKAANDPVLGNPQNSRIEIYIRSSKPAPKTPAKP